MIIELPEPHKNQIDIIDSPARFRVVMCGRRFGKSELSQVENTLWHLELKDVFNLETQIQVFIFTKNKIVNGK